MTVIFDAVILAGGSGRRLGGVDKSVLVVHGERLLDTALRAARGARTRVVVGQVSVPDEVVLTREDPPGTGPAAGLLAGLDAVTNSASWTLVLAVDLPHAPAAVSLLLAAAGVAEGDDGVVIGGADNFPQHLLAIYRTDALRRAFAAYGNPANRSIKGLLAPLHLRVVPAADIVSADIDTPDDLARWQ